jgi:hypothetical protein
MADEMDRTLGAVSKPRDGGMDVVGQRLERLVAAGIADIQRGETARPGRRLHSSKRARRPADAMQQDDAGF